MCRSSLPAPPWRSQCTYRCVVLPDKPLSREFTSRRAGLNAPTGAWCSLTTTRISIKIDLDVSQCTYRCVVLPDMLPVWVSFEARVVSQCTYRCVVLPDRYPPERKPIMIESQCTYRCVVLPDTRKASEADGRLHGSQCTYRCVVLPDPCPRERRYDATSRARSATGPGSTPPDRPAPGPE